MPSGGLVAPLPTVAAIQGHCFAAGAMLALAHDWRVMRADRGYFCLPEAGINIPFTPGMSALIQARLTPAAATAAMVGAKRFGGEEAAAVGIVDAAVAADHLVAERRVGRGARGQARGHARHHHAAHVRAGAGEVARHRGEQALPGDLTRTSGTI
jgi:enoyl-CoA hydratase/carnithine racemase